MTSDDPIAHPDHGFVPPGHYYSPIPNWQEVRRDAERIFAPAADGLPGVRLNREGQVAFLRELSTFYAEMPFAESEGSGTRYYLNNQSYAYCDGIVLYCALRLLRPKRIIEIGSGFSSCVMLDTDERFLGSRTKLTFIEPYPEVLKGLLTEEDLRRVSLIESRLQDVDLSLFDSLTAGDILFIDSTHVAKIGSDVNRIFFDILPRLPVGVYVHIHDVFYPFEYPKHWVLNGQAWNELYLLRGFLQFNTSFEIVFMSSYLAQFEAELMASFMPLAMRNTGGNLWLRRSS
jgi:predicted O-methyltransferase YrrM